MTEKSKVLTQITEELEHIKKEMEERGASMTDGGENSFKYVKNNSNFCFEH